jgi:ABC-type glycerol-3-phosphate transport system substrate-binding protein
MKIKLALCIIAVILASAFILLNPLPKGEVVHAPEAGEEITILAGQSTSDAGTEEMIEALLNKKFPGVDFEWICVDWGDGFAAQVSGKYASGNIPDILIGKTQDVIPYASQGVIAPLEKEAYGAVSEESLKYATHRKKVYGIPYNEIYQGVLYNRDIFGTYGLSPPDTEEELALIVETLETNGVTPFAAHFGESWQIGNMNMQFFMNDIFSSDPAWGDAFRARKVSYTGNHVVRKLLEHNRYILEHSFEDAIRIDQHECDIRFARGEAAMYLTGSWSLQAASQMVPAIPISVFPYPNAAGNASLLSETNMTFMKGNNGRDSTLTDSILAEIGNNAALAKEIVDYTQSKSTFARLSGYGDLPIQADVNAYREQGRLLNVAVGNSQLVWTFQNNVAAQAQLWLQGEKDLESVLRYADANRMSSAAE